MYWFEEIPSLLTNTKQKYGGFCKSKIFLSQIPRIIQLLFQSGTLGRSSSLIGLLGYYESGQHFSGERLFYMQHLAQHLLHYISIFFLLNLVLISCCYFLSQFRWFLDLGYCICLLPSLLSNLQPRCWKTFCLNIEKLIYFFFKRSFGENVKYREKRK